MKTIDLRTPKVSDAEPGDIVISTKEFEFELIEKGRWLDCTSGLVWGPVIQERVNWGEAVKKYPNLPTREQFEGFEAHGGRDVLTEMDGLWFWSSSPRGADSAYCFFYGSYSYIYGGYRSVDYYYEGVVCVSGR